MPVQLSFPDSITKVLLFLHQSPPSLLFLLSKKNMMGGMVLNRMYGEAESMGTS